MVVKLDIYFVNVVRKVILTLLSEAKPATCRLTSKYSNFFPRRFEHNFEEPSNTFLNLRTVTKVVATQSAHFSVSCVKLGIFN